MESQDRCEMRCSDEMKLGEFSSFTSWKAGIVGRKALKSELRMIQSDATDKMQPQLT
jgi:hypothetical protein